MNLKFKNVFCVWVSNYHRQGFNFESCRQTKIMLETRRLLFRNSVLISSLTTIESVMLEHIQTESV